MPLKHEVKIIELAVKKYQKEQNNGNQDYTLEDGLVYSLEEQDTGYELTPEEYTELKEKCSMAFEERQDWEEEKTQIDMEIAKNRSKVRGMKKEIGELTSRNRVLENRYYDLLTLLGDE